MYYFQTKAEDFRLALRKDISKCIKPLTIDQSVFLESFLSTTRKKENAKNIFRRRNVGTFFSFLLLDIFVMFVN